MTSLFTLGFMCLLRSLKVVIKFLRETKRYGAQAASTKRWNARQTVQS